MTFRYPYYSRRLTHGQYVVQGTSSEVYTIREKTFLPDTEVPNSLTTEVVVHHLCQNSWVLNEV